MQGGSLTLSRNSQSDCSRSAKDFCPSFARDISLNGYIQRSSNDKIRLQNNQTACYPASVFLIRLCQLQVIFHEALELCHAETKFILGMDRLGHEVWIEMSPETFLLLSLSASLYG